MFWVCMQQKTLTVYHYVFVAIVKKYQTNVPIHNADHESLKLFCNIITYKIQFEY